MNIKTIRAVLKARGRECVTRWSTTGLEVGIQLKDGQTTIWSIAPIDDGSDEAFGKFLASKADQSERAPLNFPLWYTSPSPGGRFGESEMFHLSRDFETLAAAGFKECAHPYQLHVAILPSINMEEIARPRNPTFSPLMMRSECPFCGAKLECDGTWKGGSVEVGINWKCVPHFQLDKPSKQG